MAKKVTFSSKLGLIAATVGSAVGLGNVWRFPAETQANGGAAFLLIYIGCVFLLGIPVMLAEFSIGRAGGSDAVGSFKNIGAKKGWWFAGGLGVLASYMILCFYTVVAGWTLEYLVQSLSGSLYDLHASTAAALDSQFSSKMSEFIGGTSGPLLNTTIMIIVNTGILLAGVQKGIERLSNMLMPLLFVILLILCVVSLSLPGAAAGVEFFLKPDFSAVTPATFLNALGQAFFSLSLGMGILITYASYFPKTTRLTRTAVTVSLLDMLVAVLMGFVIFPAVTSFNLQDAGLEGAGLVFVTLPEVFAQMGYPQLWSSLFFMLLAVAAITSTVSIAEVTIAFMRDRFNMSRLKACLLVMLPLLLLSNLCALSQGPLEDLKLFGFTIFDFLNFTATNLLLPVGSIFVCIYLGWFAPKHLFHQQLSNNGKLHTPFFRTALFLVRYVAPILISIIFVCGLLK
jgi:NSS family neurotransmitter:Na+ symporter